jgi:hypothetical protein
MHRASFKAFVILVTVVSIYLYFFPAAKKNSFSAALQKNFDPVFGTWQITDDTSILALQLNKDTTYTLLNINTVTRDTVSDAGKFVVDEYGVRDGTGFGFLTLSSNNSHAITYEMQVYKMRGLELIDRQTKLLTRFNKQ